jgi:hypothetical protein
MQTPFYRYADTEGIPNIRIMPKSEIQATTAPRTIAELLSKLEEFTKDETAYRNRYPWTDRFVMGYPLPKWQRPLVWDKAQKTKFITSIWLNVDIGSYLVNDVFEFLKENGKFTDVTQEFSDILLDGQQRLSAVEDYLLGYFPVPDQEGRPVFWKDLSRVERRFFGNKVFSRSVIHCWDEKELRRIYDLRAFGGTSHTPDQRASET